MATGVQTQAPVQPASANICGRERCSQELREFQRFTAMGCTFCNKVSFDIPSLLKTPQRAVSGSEQQSGSDGEGQQLSHQAVSNVKHRC